MESLMDLSQPVCCNLAKEPLREYASEMGSAVAKKEQIR